MILKKTNALLTLLLLLLFACSSSFAQAEENPLVEAIRLYDSGNYTQAENLLKQLIDENPNHLMANYYYGACRTENGHYGNKEIVFLLTGSTGEAPLKTDYYLGVQYHAKNNWEDALKHYHRFKSKTNATQQNEVHLADKIQQCYDKENPFTDDVIVADVLPTAIPREKEIEHYNPVVALDSIVVADSGASNINTYTITTADTITGESMSVTVAQTINKPKEKIIKTAPINFVIDGTLSYIDSSNFKTSAGLKNYKKGMDKQKELDRQLKQMDKLRSQYSSASSYDERQEIGAQILAAETSNYQLQNETNTLLQQAKQAEIKYWQQQGDAAKQAFTEKLYAQQFEIEEASKETIEDSTSFINADALLGASPEISSTDATDDEDELIYKIQLGAYSRGLPTYIKKLFKKLSYIRKIENYTDDKGVVVYTTGNLSNLDDAIKMQNQVRQEGVEDAFVVPYFNGKRITLKEAKEIESER